MRVRSTDLVACLRLVVCSWRVPFVAKVIAGFGQITRCHPLSRASGAFLCLQDSAEWTHQALGSGEHLLDG